MLYTCYLTIKLILFERRFLGATSACCICEVITFDGPTGRGEDGEVVGDTTGVGEDDIETFICMAQSGLFHWSVADRGEDDEP